MFKRKKFSNDTIAAVAPQPETTINHNYAPSRAGLVLVVFVSVVMAFILFWYALVFLADRAGYHNPEKAVAEFLIWLFVGLSLLALAIPALRWLLLDYYKFREALELRKADILIHQARLAQLAPPQASASMSYDESRKYMAVKLVMDRAYHSGVMGDDGKILTRALPWSVRQVGAIVLPGERSPIGKDSSLAAWVAGYLAERVILLDEKTVNLVKFPGLSSVEAQLVKDFGRPISYSGGADKGFSMSGQYVSKGKGGGSFT